MKLLLLFVFISLLPGCVEYSGFEQRGPNILIYPKGVSVDKVSIIKWKVGPLRRQTVSKGVNIRIALPQLEKKHIKKLVETNNVNSWLMRLRREGSGRREVMAHMSVPIITPRGKGEKSFRIKQVKAGTIKVYFAAAAISTRFERFMCPAFDHRKVIEDVKIQTGISINRSLLVSPSEESPVLVKVEPFNYSPLIVNAGSSLIGQYAVDISLFNSVTKNRMSNWMEIESRAEILSENEVLLKGCANFKIPKRKDDNQTQFEKFKFKR